eukprot:SAG11_NODE_29840_length_306_cov_1.314010_1_plen_46_part_10
MTQIVLIKYIHRNIQYDFRIVLNFAVIENCIEYCGESDLLKLNLGM